MACGHRRDFVTRIRQWIATVRMRKGDAGPLSSAVPRRHRTKQDLRRALLMLKDIQDMRQNHIATAERRLLPTSGSNLTPFLRDF
jgi:hypothetical protein